MKDRIRFGPAGNSQSFYNQGHKGTIEAPAWLHQLGLDAFEYSFGHGIRGSENLWRQLHDAFAAHDIALSVHAPYYINFCSANDGVRLRSRQYLTDTIRAAGIMGAGRVVVHPGSVAKGTKREEALQRVRQELLYALAETDTDELRGILVCPETMGKLSQLGTVDEVLALCEPAPARLLPTLDFGHINARGQGSLGSSEDFEEVFDRVEERLGKESANRVHIHFSRIEYGKSGEIRHLTFDDGTFGPFFEPLAVVLARREYRPVVICESAGTMAEDALKMKDSYEMAL